MKTQDNFCGTKSMAKVARKRGHSCQTLDNNPVFDADIKEDIKELNPGYCFYAHFSPPCLGFSVAAISKNWKKTKDGYEPISEKAREGIRLLHRIAYLISVNEYEYWTVENPRCIFRKLFPTILKSYGVTDFRMVTVTYCQYGDDRMKPTDFFTNIKNWQGRKCNNGDKCHTPAPRGSQNGTEGLKNAIIRGKIPEKLFEEIFEIIERRRE